MLSRARVGFGAGLALLLLVGIAPPSDALPVIPTAKRSQGTATAYYSSGGPGTPYAYANLFLTGKISFGLTTVEGIAWTGLSLQGDTPFLLYSPPDLGYREIGTCHEVDTVLLELEAPATATLECKGRLGDTGPMGVTVFEVVLPTATPISQYHYDMRYDGVYAG